MERRIEYRNLRRLAADELLHGLNAAEVVGIVQRRQVDAVFNPGQHLVIDQHRLLEHFAAMHYAMAHRLNIAQRANLFDAGPVGGQVPQNVIEPRAYIADGSGEFLPGSIFRFYGHDGLATDSLHRAAAQPLVGVLTDPVGVRGNYLKLQAGASRVQH